MHGTGTALPDFPARAECTDATALAPSLCLRPATEADLPFLRELYAGTRTAELDAVPWPESMRAAFLGDQFALQHRHWLQCYPQAEYLIVERQGQQVGRCYVDFDRAALHGDALRSEEHTSELQYI